MMPEAVTQAIPDRPPGKPFPWPCPRCRRKTVWPIVMPYQSQLRHEGQLHTVILPRLNVPRCTQCGELLFDNWADDQIDLAFRHQVHLLTPQQIQANRTDLGLSRQELATRIGIGEDLLARWEEDQ